MTYEEAFLHIGSGAEVCRPSWNGAWIFIDGDEIKMNTRTNQVLPYVMPEYDMLADDWSIISRGEASAIGFAEV